MSDALVINDATVEQETWADPVRGEVSFRTIFGAQHRTHEFTAGVTEVPPGGWLGHHRHVPAEIYYVIDGEGTLTIDDEDYRVAAGTAAYIPSGSEHGIRNTGHSLLRFFFAFAVGGSSDKIQYRFKAEQ
jgi:quercetin dioxygenase-like cupin family protein